MSNVIGWRAPLESWHCVNCSRKLGEYHIVAGTVSQRCRKCGAVNVLVVGADAPSGGVAASCVRKQAVVY